MNVIRCKNGHFFDGDAYDVCPHCGDNTGEMKSTTVNKEEKKNFWGRGRKDKKNEKQSNTDIPLEASNETDIIADVPTEYMAINDLNEEHIRIENENIFDDASTSLKELVKDASASKEGKTLSYFSSATGNYYGKKNERKFIEPVVAWLVCIAGYHFGESFCVCDGKNSIGRGEDNRIVIEGDSRISKNKHALITYEPKRKNYYLQPGDSSGLTYLNDEYMTESQKLNPYDVIELGDSKFVFVPLCGETFSWENFVKKGD